MKKEQIVEVLETIATLLELQEENPFKIRAYTNAARSIETWGGNLRELAEENRLEEIPGVGKAIAGKITELVTDRFVKVLRRAAGQISARDSRTVFPARPRCEKDQGALRETAGWFDRGSDAGLRRGAGRGSCLALEKRPRISLP